MPRGDGTGPMGMGPMTGCGAGYCNDFAVPGCGFGCGIGRGRGHRNMFRATGTPGWARYGYPTYTGTNTPVFDEKTFLNNQVELLENQLQQVKKRLFNLNEKSE